MRNIIAKLEKNGYEVMVYRTESGITGVNVVQSGKEYAPQITDTFGAETLGETEFTIMTTSYGGLTVKEIKKVMAGYEKAIEAVEYFKEQLVVIEKAEAEQKELEERFNKLVTMFEEEGIECEGSTQEHEYIVAYVVAGDYEAEVKVELNNKKYTFQTLSHKEMTTLEGVKELVEKLSK